ncbi:hypothetical protein GOP47_0024287 [Adiantum capillus-veneris]|uniref:Uncharacterized protein n=1 Tax=Adiantum capillus-veneris TaxID=13818 RepID=A0A9D4U1Z8_ADICA|nr:hypothetical protein GOP47_0024287 [Adiantum capillus-veneris]
MKKGECLEEEKENYLHHWKGECKSDSGSSGEMTVEQRKKMEEELKALKEKEDQEREVHGGRPPSSKGGMSIKDTRNLGSCHTQKNVRKGALIHAPLASFHSIQKKGDIKQSKVWIYDNIELGKEFTARNFKDGFVVMREYFVGLGEHEKIRNGKPSAWSVDLTVIDLPTGGLVQGFDGILAWNELTDDHVKFSLVVASTMMDDMGWVLVLCPSTNLSLVETWPHAQA